MQESEIACVPHCATGETLELVHSGSSAGELFEERKDSPEDRAKPDFPSFLGLVATPIKPQS